MSNSPVNILEVKFNRLCSVSSLSFFCLIRMISFCLPESSCLLFTETMNEESYLLQQLISLVNSQRPFSHWLALNTVLRGLCKQVLYEFAMGEGNLSVAEDQDLLHVC